MSPRLAGEVRIRAPVNSSPTRSRAPRPRTTTGLFAGSRSRSRSRLPASDDDGPFLICSTPVPSTAAASRPPM